MKIGKSAAGQTGAQAAKEAKQTKVQTKIVAVILTAVILVAFICISQGVLVTRISTNAAIEKNLQETVEVAAQSTQNMISTYTLVIAEIASNPTLIDPEVSLEQQQAFVQSRVSAYYMRFGGMADTNGYDAYHNVSIANEPFFEAAMRGESYMSTPYIDGSDAFLMVAAPIKNGNSIVGVLYFQCDNSILQSIVTSIKVGEYGEAYILDKQGNTIAYVDEQLVLEKENIIQEAAASPKDKDLQKLANIEQHMVNGQTGVEKYYYSADHTNNYQAYAPIPGTDGWSIAVTVRENEFMQTAYIGSLIQLAICLIATLIVMLAAGRISRAITRPIVQCAGRLQLLAGGDLHSPAVQVNTRDEIRVLADSTTNLVNDLGQIVNEIGQVLSAISDGDLTSDSAGKKYPGDFQALQEYLQIINAKLNQTISGIVSAADQVAAGANQMANSSVMLSQSAMEQAGAVQELSAAVEDMSRSAQETADISSQAKTTVNSAGEHLHESNRYINSLNEAMTQITASSNEIGRIIDTIENIAFQTNILALNASVEAARAGAAGKGFAVVADEVRNLAAKSDQAARATKNLIQHSVDAVTSGSEVVALVTQSVTSVVDLAEQAVTEMDKVADAVEQQKTSIEQVTNGIGMISQGVQSTSATAQESAAASEELSSQADILKRLVNNFRLK